MSLNPINPNDPNLRSFAEIDLELLLPKGSAFRAFKALADEFREARIFSAAIPGSTPPASPTGRRPGGFMAGRSTPCCWERAPSLA
jgi:hypothetical protein